MIIMIKIIGLKHLIMLIKRLSATVFRSYYKNYFISKNKWEYSLLRKLDHTHTSLVLKLLPCNTSRRQYWHLDCG